MAVIVVGAGLSGLIAGNMLRSGLEMVVESQETVPNNHSALLRFKTSVVGDAVGIPFQEVRVMKAIHQWRNPVADAISYSVKCTGAAEIRSVVSASGEIERRFIAPDDFIQQLVRNIHGGAFCFGEHFQFNDWRKNMDAKAVISTIPMPVLMQQLGWKAKSQFHWMNGYTITADIPERYGVNICATVYLPDPSVDPYRVSITGRRLIIEVAGRRAEVHPYHHIVDSQTARLNVIRDGLWALGLLDHIGSPDIDDVAEVKEMKYAKILPIDEQERRSFLMWATANHGIYSLGRFATWRPKLLLDDVVNDVRVIQRMIGGDNSIEYMNRMDG